MRAFILNTVPNEFCVVYTKHCSGWNDSLWFSPENDFFFTAINFSTFANFQNLRQAGNNQFKTEL